MLAINESLFYPRSVNHCFREKHSYKEEFYNEASLVLLTSQLKRLNAFEAAASLVWRYETQRTEGTLRKKSCRVLRKRH
jgi:hypothetical protein